jgi:MOSC domain-containing protein YiiM
MGMALELSARVVSVNVGRPQSVVWQGEIVQTAIFKEPVAGKVAIRHDNLDGDQQADLRAHGGPAKAIYLYPTDYYDLWRQELRRDLPWGTFGENLTVTAMPNDAICIGDLFRTGTAAIRVTQPRIPCFKLGIRMGDQRFVQRFLQSGRTGFYCAIAQEGEIEAGDTIELIAREDHGLTVADIVRLYAQDRDDIGGMQRALIVDSLAAGWHKLFHERLDRAARSN